MAGFEAPSIHDVSGVRAEASIGDHYACLTLAFRQGGRPFDDLSTLEIFVGHPVKNPTDELRAYVRALATAINSVPLPRVIS